MLISHLEHLLIEHHKSCIIIPIINQQFNTIPVINVNMTDLNAGDLDFFLKKTEDLKLLPNNAGVIGVTTLVTAERGS